MDTTKTKMPHALLSYALKCYERKHGRDATSDAMRAALNASKGGK